MNISLNEVKYVANLARLDLNDAQVAAYAEKISQILAYMEKLKTVDTENISPTSHATGLNNVFRMDEITNHLDNQEAVANAPQAEDGCFIVPKVI